MIKKIFYTLYFIVALASFVRADELSDSMGSLYERFPSGGFSSDGTSVVFHDDFYDKYPQYFFGGAKTPPTQSEVAGWKDAYQALSSVKTRQIAVVTAQAQSLLSGYSLYFGQQRWTDYQAALNATVATATTEINAMADIASVKNYQPIWPQKPYM